MIGVVMGGVDIENFFVVFNWFEIEGCLLDEDEKFGIVNFVFVGG